MKTGNELYPEFIITTVNLLFYYDRRQPVFYFSQLWIGTVTEVTRSRVPKRLLTLHSYGTTYKPEK